MIPPFVSAFPDLTREELETRAREHAARRIGIPENEVFNVDRLVVNLLRHTATNYDCDQSARRHTASCDAIARRYPWLAEECARQMLRREDECAWERRIGNASGTREHTLSVGNHVAAIINGRERNCEVVEVGRRKVLLRYGNAPRTGTARVHVSLVRRNS